MDISLPTIVILGVLGALFLWGYSKRGSMFAGKTGITPKELGKKRKEAQSNVKMGGTFSSGGFGEFGGARRRL